MVRITSFRKGAKVFPYRSAVNNHVFMFVAPEDRSVHSESVLDYLDQNPGETDPWPHLETIGSDGSFHWNPVIHYSLDGRVSSIKNQTDGAISDTPIIPGESGMMAVDYASTPWVYAFVDFGEYAVCAAFLCPIQSTRINIRQAGINSLYPETRGFLLDTSMFIDVSDPVGSLIQGMRSNKPLYDLKFNDGYYHRPVAVTRAYPYVVKPSAKLSVDALHQLRVDAVSSFNWGDLARDLYTSVEFGTESNGIAYGLEYTQMSDTVQKLFNTLTVGKAKSVSKTLASLYLSYHYGWKLTYLDTLSMIRELESLPISLKKIEIGRVITRRGLSTYSMCTWADTSQKQLDLLRDLATKLDAILTLENVWDLVPYSFVVDWLMPLGDSLNALDHFMTLEYEYTSCIQSKTWSYSDPAFPVHEVFPQDVDGTLALNLYQRRFSSTLEKPSFFPNLQSPLHHIVEGSSLIVANATRPNKKLITW